MFNQIISFFRGKNNKLPRVVNQKILEEASSYFAKEENEKEMERIRQHEAQKAAMPKNMEWLKQEVYDHVCWNEYGSGVSMSYYFNKIEKELTGEESEKEIIEYKKALIGY